MSEDVNRIFFHHEAAGSPNGDSFSKSPFSQEAIDYLETLPQVYWEIRFPGNSDTFLASRNQMKVLEHHNISFEILDKDKP